jgi:hypothetical protein
MIVVNRSGKLKLKHRRDRNTRRQAQDSWRSANASQWIRQFLGFSSHRVITSEALKGLFTRRFCKYDSSPVVAVVLSTCQNDF